ncbi:MAG TPA: serine hydrolase domain-containing protein [Stellaceae bacterium]|nr:serine hydrolase domain-containing protein [Stellaceae bacterium]
MNGIEAAATDTRLGSPMFPTDRNSIGRRMLARIVAGAAATTLAGRRGHAAPAGGSDAPSDSERAAMAATAEALMRRHDLPGLAVAIAHRGRILYDEAFGMAVRETGERLTTAHRFRIASLSKPITSATLFTLNEAGKVGLGDRVFGRGAVLGTEYGVPPYREYVDRVTIETLLTHTSGGWPNDNTDPMMRNPGMTHRQLIAWAIRDIPLKHRPGTHYAYSNFGYCILGRVIEHLTGQQYDAFVRSEVLQRCGVATMEIAGNTPAERRPNEVRYYAQGTDDAYGLNVTRMDSHGGWIATAADLLRFTAHVDGFPDQPSLLKPETIQTMATGSRAEPGYAKGWQVNDLGNWWHSGSLPGTATILVRTHADFCWAILTNASRDGLDLDKFGWDMVGKVGRWQA